MDYRLHLWYFCLHNNRYGRCELGGPAGCFIAVVIGTEFGKIVSKETKIDIIVTPMVTILMGVLTAQFVGPGIAALMNALGDLIMKATELKPIPMGVLVSLLMGLALTAPISSAL